MNMIPDTLANRILASQAARVKELLTELAEYLERYEDVEDGSDGRPVANKAMSLRARILAELVE